MNRDLHNRWHAKTGEDMPTEFSELPRHMMLKAVEAVERGDTPFVPKLVRREEVAEESMCEWDKHKEF